MKDYNKTLMSAILAGVCIGIGGVVFLSLEDKVLGALFFTIGLFVICTMKFHLFTGKICYVFKNDKSYALQLPIIWIGNLIGTNLVARLVSFTRIVGIAEKATNMCNTKLSDSYASLFVLGILCNMLIYIAVEGYANILHDVGKYLSLFFGVAVFILCGFEHCVADMFYFSMADMLGTDGVFIRLLVITLGNAVGGVFFPLCRAYLEKSKPIVRKK